MHTLLLLLLLPAAEAKRPNILWLTCEDMSCNLGCYGDRDAATPNLDAFAKQAVKYNRAFSTCGVCAPSRSALITGMYPSTLGSHYMRCKIDLPKEVRAFSAHLRDAGFYCTNNVKTDYNFAVPKDAWDANSRTAHYRGRKKGQPFFAVFNNTVTHESQIRAAEAAFQKNTARLTRAQRHDPAKITVPPFHPDVPEVRKDWARYHDLVSAMDIWFGDMLTELEKEGVADDTIVFFYSDHGVGLPRGKRWLYDTGMKVPLLIRFGKNWTHLAPGKAGSETGRLVSFVDFGPTALSLAGVEPPNVMQGVPFLGKHEGKAREAVYGIRDRMDERNDCTRAVRDARFKYIRNYMPWKPWAQPLAYMELMPTMQAWRKLKAEGKLKGEAALWMADQKPTEELYDTEADPHEVKNLAGEKKYEEHLRRLRGLHTQWRTETRDLGQLPEALVWEWSRKATRYDLGLAIYGARSSVALSAGQKALAAWWFETIRGEWKGVKAIDAPRDLLKHESPTVRVAAAADLVRFDTDADAFAVLLAALKDENPWVRHAAILALDDMGPKRAAKAKDAIKAALKDANEYVVRVAQHLDARLP